MGSIQVITGSLAGTKLTGAYGSIYAITDSQITVTGSGFQSRFVLPRGQNFTDTGTWNTDNSFTEITAWSKANIVVQSA
jgi:flagellar basal body P-ring protein FlgI